MRDVVVLEHLAEQLQVDRPAQDGGPSEQSPASPVETIDPARQQRFEPVGQVLQAALLGRRGRQLAGEQRVAGRPLGDRGEIGVGQGGRAGRSESDPDHGLRLERRQVDPRRGRVPRTGVTPGRWSPITSHGFARCGLGQGFEQGERRLVGPMEVLEDQQSRRLEGLPEQLDDRRVQLR